MGYNVIDLIDKAIKVSNCRKEIYENIGKKKCDIPCMEIMSKVLTKGIDKNIKYYEVLKNEISKEVFDEIDFYVYDKMSFLIDEFNKKTYAPKINNVREYLEFSLELEKDSKALLIDVQGRFVKNTSDLHTKTYDVLSSMIENKSKNIKLIEETLKCKTAMI